MDLPQERVKGLYRQNFEKAVNSMTCVQIVYILMVLKMSKKNSKWYPAAMVTNENPRKGAKNAFTQGKISQVGEKVQN